MKAQIVLSAGALNAALAVMLGAFGAHGLKSRLSEYSLGVFQTGVEYHFYHALGLLVIGLLIHLGVVAKAGRVAGLLMLTGIFVFSGSLYLLSVTGIKWLGAITPIGGMAFISAWIILAVSLLRSTAESETD